MKCGALFEPLFDEDEIKHDFQRLITLLQAIENAEGIIPEQDEAIELLSKYQIGDRITLDDFKVLKKTAEKKYYDIIQLANEKASEPNEKISRVQTTHPGIELVQFCINDNMKSKWKGYQFSHTMGETLFWKFIAPKFFLVQELVGCEYAFLFAADLSEDGTLVNYYDVSLKFKKRLDLGTNKPFYDFCCIFMCQEINEMKRNKEIFFENFHIDEEDSLA